MDMITLAMAKAYSDSKGGYSKTTLAPFCDPFTLPKGESVQEGDFVQYLDNMVAGATYIVSINGVRHETKCRATDGSFTKAQYIGNPSLLASSGYDTGESFSYEISTNAKATFEVIWTKQTIYNADGETIYLEACDPIPVYE